MNELLDGGSTPPSSTNFHKEGPACTEGWPEEIFIYCKILGECSASFALFSCKGYMWGELQFYPTAAILLEIGKIFQITGGQDVQP